MTAPSAPVGDLTIGTALDPSGVMGDLRKLQQQVNRETGLTLDMDAKPALSAIDQVRADVTALGALSKQDAAARTQATRLLGTQFATTTKSLQAQTAELKQQAAATAANTAKLREQGAQLTLSTRLSQQISRDEKMRSQASINALSMEMHAYRNLWQARQLSDAEVIQAQRRIHSEALIQLQTVDKTSDAYRRLTQVAAGAQRTIDSASGQNTPGGFGAGIQQGIAGVLGQFGIAGDLLGGFVQLIAAKKAAAANVAEGLGSDTMEGLIKGMKGDQARVKQTAENTAESIEQAIRDELDIRSPSRVMEYLGQMVGDGFVSGIRSRWNDAKRAASGLSDAAQGGINTRVGGISGGGIGGVALPIALGGVLEAGKISGTSQALDGLNKQLELNAAASATAASAGAATEVATEALGGAVEGAAEQVQAFTDARKEGDDVAREAAINDAKTALAFTAIAAGATALAVAITLSYNAAADYEKAMNDAQAKTEATASQMQKLDAIARSPALEKLAVDGITAAGAISELGGAGLNTQQILDGGLVSALSLSKALGSDVTSAAKTAAGVVKSFSMDVKDLNHVGDIVTSAINSTSVASLEDFNASIAAGGEAAGQAGVEFVDYTAVISFMTDKLIGASDAGTSFKAFVSGLTPNSKEAKASMKEMGFSAFDAQGRFKSLGQIIDELRDIFAKLTPEQRATTAELWFGSDGFRALNILIQQGSEGLEKRIALLNRMGTMDESARKKLEGARGAQDQFNAALKNFQIAFGESFLPAGTAFLKFLDDALRGTKSLVTELVKLTTNQGAAYGAQVYDLPTWLQQSGLRESDLTPDELKRVKSLLSKMQLTANTSASDANTLTNFQNMLPGDIPFDGLKLALQGLAERTAKAIGQMGVELGAIQRDVSQRPRRQGPEQGGEASDAPVVVSGKALVQLLGMGNRRVLNEFGVTGDDYHHDGAVRHDAVHNGIDYGAPRGAPILAPFSGTLSYRENGTSGKIFELVDAKGNALVGIHLDSFNKEIMAALEAGGGKALVNAGSLLGRVGNSGTTAGSYPHLHLMGYRSTDKDRTNPVNPTSVAFQSSAEKGLDSSAFGSKPPPIDMGGGIQKTFAQYEAEARRILDQIKKYAPDGKSPNGEKWAKASGQLEAFTKDNEVAAKALAYVQLEMGKTSKATSQYGQTFDRLKGQLGVVDSLKDLGMATGEYTSKLDGISKAAKSAADAEYARYKETPKYIALLGLSGDAAKKAQTERERVQRETEASQAEADREAETAARNRAEVQQQITSAVQADDLDAARRGLTRLKTNQSDRLALYKNDAVQRAKVVKESGPGILEAEAQIAAEVRKQAETAAQVWADSQKGKPGVNAAEVETERLRRVKEAVNQEARTMNLARADQRRAEKAAGEAALELETQLADELSGLQIEKAQQTALRLQAIEQNKIKAQEGNLQKQLELTRTYSQNQFNRAEEIARATQQRTINGAAGKPNEAAIVDTANETYRTSVATARLTRAEAVKTAQTALTNGIKAEDTAVKTLQARYDALRVSLEQRGKAGQLTTEDLAAYARNLGELWADAGQAGIKGRAEIEQAHAAAKAFGITASGINEVALHNLAEQAQYVGQTKSLIESLPKMSEEKLLEVYSEAVANKDQERLTAIYDEYERRAEQAAADQRVVYQMQADANTAMAEGTKAVALEMVAAGDRAGGIELLEKELSGLMDAAQRGEDAAEAIGIVIDIINKLSDTTADVDADLRVVFQLQADANLALAQSAKTASDELANAGDSEGALAVLENRLSEVMDAAERGEDAADAINQLVEAIHSLTGSQGITDEFNQFVSTLEGTISDQIDTVATRLEEITDPAMRAKLKGLLNDLRGQLPSYDSASAAGLIPGANGFSNQASGDLTPGIAQARDLGTLIAETTDPAVLQGLMAEATDFLAGEIGATLPDTVRTALEEAVEGADSYIKILQDITGDAVVDGWERASQTLPDGPTNRFLDLTQSVFDLKDALKDPTQAAALTDSLNAARLAGELTSTELEYLLRLVKQLQDEEPIIPEDLVNRGQENLNSFAERALTLDTQLSEGQIDKLQAAQALRELAEEAERYAAAAYAAGNIELGDKFRELAQGARAATGPLGTLMNVQEYAGYVQELAGGFAELFEALGEGDQTMADIGANLRGAENLAGKVVALAGDIARIVANPADIGAWVGAITKIVSGIAEALSGFQKAKAEAKRIQEDFNKGFTLINGDNYSKTFVRSRGWLADTFGGGPEVKQEINELGLKIAQSIEGGLVNGIKNGLKTALTTGNWDEFSNTFRKSAFEGVVDGIIEAVFNKALQDILAPGIKALTDAAETEDTSDDAAAVDVFTERVKVGERFATQFGQRIAPTIDRLRGNLGISTDDLNTGGVSGAGSLASLPEPLQFALATPLLEGVRGIKDAATTLQGAATTIDAAFKRGVIINVNTPSGSYSSSTGALSGG